VPPECIETMTFVRAGCATALKSNSAGRRGKAEASAPEETCDSDRASPRPMPAPEDGQFEVVRVVHTGTSACAWSSQEPGRSDYRGWCRNSRWKREVHRNHAASGPDPQLPEGNIFLGLPENCFTRGAAVARARDDSANAEGAGRSLRSGVSSFK